MTTTDLKLDEPGTLARPGLLGKTVRLALGFLCLWYVFGLWRITGDLIDSAGHIRQLIWNGVIVGLFLISYIVNIGYTRDWKKWPAIISFLVFLVIGILGYLMQGSFETRLLSSVIWIWEIYLFTHLGLAFLLSALIGSPGCEMRAFHHLYSKVSGNPTKEHYCPIGPLHAIDRWEAKIKKH
jgi:hypothetical protein